MENVASKIAAKCGGAPVVAEVLGVHVSRVYRWALPKSRGGSDGLIPSKHHAPLIAGMKARGVKLKPADFFAAKIAA